MQVRLPMPGPLLNNTQAVLELKCEHEVYINVVKNILCI